VVAIPLSHSRSVTQVPLAQDQQVVQALSTHATQNSFTMEEEHVRQYQFPLLPVRFMAAFRTRLWLSGFIHRRIHHLTACHTSYLSCYRVAAEYPQHIPPEIGQHYGDPQSRKLDPHLFHNPITSMGISRRAKRNSANELSLSASHHRPNACTARSWRIVSIKGSAIAVSANRAVSGLQGQVGISLILLCLISRLAIVPFSLSASAYSLS
jgi:hypothetical protein